MTKIDSRKIKNYNLSGNKSNPICLQIRDGWSKSLCLFSQTKIEFTKARYVESMTYEPQETKKQNACAWKFV